MTRSRSTSLRGACLAGMFCCILAACSDDARTPASIPDPPIVPDAPAMPLTTPEDAARALSLLWRALDAEIRARAWLHSRNGLGELAQHCAPDAATLDEAAGLLTYTQCRYAPDPQHELLADGSLLELCADGGWAGNRPCTPPEGGDPHIVYHYGPADTGLRFEETRNGAVTATTLTGRVRVRALDSSGAQRQRRVLDARLMLEPGPGETLYFDDLSTSFEDVISNGYHAESYAGHLVVLAPATGGCTQGRLELQTPELLESSASGIARGRLLLISDSGSATLSLQDASSYEIRVGDQAAQYSRAEILAACP